MLATFALGGIFASCNSDDSSDQGFGYVTAKVGTYDYATTTHMHTAAMRVNEDMLIISTDTRYNLDIRIDDYDGVGTYTTQNNVIPNMFMQFTTLILDPELAPIPSMSSIYQGGEMTVNVTAANPRSIQGNFTGKIRTEGSEELTVVSQGSFLVEIEQSNSNVPGN